MIGPLAKGVMAPKAPPDVLSPAGPRVLNPQPVSPPGDAFLYTPRTFNPFTGCVV